VERLPDGQPRERARLARTTCERYAETFPALAKRGTNLLLVGPMGTGKTGLACAIANHVVREHAASAIFISAYGAVRHQRDTWRKRGKTETEALADLIDPDLLVLDEVGVQVGSDSEMLMLFEVLNGRYANRQPTVLISNLPAQGEHSLRAFLGERLWSRYTDDASFVLACDWPNLRGAKQP
jgi:DNA replication protein DnaC